MSKDNYSTNDLENLLKETNDVKEVLDSVNKDLVDVTPGLFLRELVASSEITNRVFLTKLSISTSYFYEILNGCKIPRRDVFIQFLITADLGLKEANNALKKCGYCQLYAKNRRDAVIIFALSKGLSVIDTNIILESLNLPLLLK